MATSNFTLFNQFTEDNAKGVHNFTSDATCSLKVALCASANAPNPATHAVLADLVQIAYTNLSSRQITGVTAEQTGGSTPITMADLQLTASGGSVAPFRYIIIYNDTPAGDPLIGFWDLGANLTLADTQFLLIDPPTGSFVNLNKV